MSRVFIPSFGRRRRSVPEAVVAAPEVKLPEWAGRKRETCVLVKLKLCEGKGTFIPRAGNHATCSKKCSEILRRITHAPIAAKWAKDNPKKSQRAVLRA
jgi:hypothetical protein